VLSGIAFEGAIEFALESGFFIPLEAGFAATLLFSLDAEFPRSLRSALRAE